MYVYILPGVCTCTLNKVCVQSFNNTAHTPDTSVPGTAAVHAN